MVHTTLQAPQLVPSAITSTQASPHCFSGGVHTHEPAWQLRCAGHALPQVPQFAESVIGSMQPAPHGKRPAAHADEPPAPTPPVFDGVPVELSPQAAHRIAKSTLETEPRTLFIAKYLCASVPTLDLWIGAPSSGNVITVRRDHQESRMLLPDPISVYHADVGSVGLPRLRGHPPGADLPSPLGGPFGPARRPSALNAPYGNVTSFRCDRSRAVN